MTENNRRLSVNIATAVAMIALAVVIAALAGCAVGPNYVKPDTQVATQFEGARDGAYSGGEAQAQYWTQFGDDTLNHLVEESLHANHDLRIALSHLVEARALHRQSEFDLAPTVTASGGYTRERFPAVDSPTGAPLSAHFYDAGFDAFWELDLFGRVRRGVEARRAEVQGAEATLADAQVSVTAEVARTYFELRGAQTQLAVAQKNVSNQRETLKLTQARLDAGRGTQLDTARAGAQLSSTLATIGPLEAQVARAIHRLSVLTGREPNALNALLAPARELPELPRIAAVGDPAALLRRRPDIRVAERTLAASTARVGLAIGDLFPKVTFNGSFNYTAVDAGDLGQSGTRGYVIGPSISWAAFDLGRVHAEIAGSRAQADASLAGYEQTVLRALEETENALVTHARTRDALQNAADAAQQSLTAARIARARFEGGTADFLEVLDAERTQLAAEDRLAQVRTDAATSLIAVYKALGGSWEMAPLPAYVRQAGG
ncbi:MAG TPA: efflux transporter outer membrane subunit [Candidatus Dormibacteraeota bacterium]|nr:efflux transporter outer membrane subunit [Candidatus Dormibacteraeota bacterium]